MLRRCDWRGLAEWIGLAAARDWGALTEACVRAIRILSLRLARPKHHKQGAEQA